ncbi:MAG: hypothetical protein A2428_00550 [Bdellovibrionales bacterium RIFOXYC1_FULL_54_43]|nr:MAG: hypothetical protein A2428_00550 [Bdellovibrionales bacterium RIFOXYC1_FULL_54_43]OFZ82478.1 MAG: hypothetical protein A2603_15525 [Bdellovibrionales bacterium RIFOXYD1_FULL_55_31]
MGYDQGGNCWSCGRTLTVLDYGRADTCPKCGRDTKTCKGCQFYDQHANNECHESQADPVLEKERSNFCDYFKPRSGTGSETSTRDALKAAAEALFKK